MCVYYTFFDVIIKPLSLQVLSYPNLATDIVLLLLLLLQCFAILGWNLEFVSDKQLFIILNYLVFLFKCILQKNIPVFKIDYVNIILEVFLIFGSTLSDFLEFISNFGRNRDIRNYFFIHNSHQLKMLDW